jgi:hypothetical protein
LHGDFQIANGQVDKIVSDVRQEKNLGCRRIVLAVAMSTKGWIFATLGMLEDSQRMYWESLRLWQAEKIDGARAFLKLILKDLASVCLEMGKCVFAEQLYQRAYYCAVEANMPIHEQYLMLLCVADALRVQGKLNQMDEILSACLAMLREFEDEGTSHSTDLAVSPKLLEAAAVFEVTGLLWSRGESVAAAASEEAWIRTVENLLPPAGEAGVVSMLRLLCALSSARQGQGFQPP